MANCAINCYRFIATTAAATIFAPPSIYAQLRWQKADKDHGYLPKSIHLFKTTDSLHGRAITAWYVQIASPPEKLEYTLQFANDNTHAAGDYYREADSPYVIMNAAPFSAETGGTTGLIVQEGALKTLNLPALKSRNSDSFYYPTRAAIGFTKKGHAETAWTFTDTGRRYPYAFYDGPVIAKGAVPVPGIRDLHTLQFYAPWHMYTAFGAGPMLVRRGDIRITSREEQFGGDSTDRCARIAMGYTKKGNLIILVIAGGTNALAGVTLAETATIMKSIGCRDALQVSSGESSFMLLNGRALFDSAGNDAMVPSVFLVRAKK